MTELQRALPSTGESHQDRELRAALLAECERLEEYAKWNAAAHFTASTLAGRVHAVAGVVPIALGALGTWSGMKLVADQPTAALVASVASLIAGIAGSVLSFWNLSETRVKHFKGGTAYKTIENEARRARAVFIDTSDGELREVVAGLAARYDKLGDESAQSSDFAFWLASKKVRTGRYDPDASDR